MERQDGVLNPTWFSYLFLYGHAVTLRFDNELCRIIEDEIVLQIRTFRPVEEIQHCHKIPAASFNEIHDFLDEHCLSTLSKTNAPLHATTLSPPQENSRSPASTGRATPLDGASSSSTSVKLEDLGHEFGVPEDVMEGMRYLDGMVRKSEDFKDLVNWSSTMGRCVIFYWTCSVLKVFWHFLAPNEAFSDKHCIDPRCETYNASKSISAREKGI
ncbi:hypothetical protein JB92DRAFT_1341442 [Gautieria morchelliformis]|nr:hypothetical protein JB92DRAFT_1341442 [Gautieria morchelliformis]